MSVETQFITFFYLTIFKQHQQTDHEIIFRPDRSAAFHQLTHKSARKFRREICGE